jgi:hypothetical protein
MPLIPTSVNIATADTHVISARPCLLGHLVINGGTMGSITIYDSSAAASGRKIATIAAPIAGYVYPYQCSMLYGIVIVTAEATDISVSFA